jgi:hypothetical protein
MTRALLLLFCAAALLGCPNTDTAVFVAPEIAAPAADLSSSAFGIGLTGSFRLNLHLGARASGPSEVSIGSFEIVDAGQKSTIVASLPVETTTRFPVTVEPDGDVSVEFTFDSGTEPLPAELEGELCDPAGVVVKGVVEDALLNAPTPVFSAVFHVSGC